jgi:ankyrin repeat protein
MALRRMHQNALTALLGALVLLVASSAAAQVSRPTALPVRGDVNPSTAVGAGRTEADGTTALHWAVRRGNLAEVDRLIAAGANVSARNRYGVTPLSLASEAGDPALVERLLRAGADARTVVTEGQTVLMVAARTGNPQVLRQLVAAGADVNAKESFMGETALMWAAAADNAAAVRALAEMGAQVNAKSATIAYPEQKPAEPSNYVASYVPKGQWTPLMYAAREDAAAAAAALLDAGADINVQDPEGVTPLLQAILNLHYDFAKMLLDRGADPRIADKVGMTPVFAVVEMRTPTWERSRPRMEERGDVDGPALIGFLIDKGADPDAALTGRQQVRYHGGGSAAFAQGTTPLIQAVRFKHLDLARVLVERGASVHLKQADGSTALMIAAGVKYAITQEGDPDNMGSPQDAFEIVKMLVEKGAEVNLENERGETALYGAAFIGYSQVIQYLVDRGARLDVKTKTNRTIYDAVLNTGVPDEGTGARPGGKPSATTVELVRTLMLKAGIEPTAQNVVRREARQTGVGLTDPDPVTPAAPAAPAAPAPQLPR